MFRVHPFSCAEGCTTIRKEIRHQRAELRTVLDFLRKGDVLIVTRKGDVLIVTTRLRGRIPWLDGRRIEPWLNQIMATWGASPNNIGMSAHPLPEPLLFAIWYSPFSCEYEGWTRLETTAYRA